MDAGQVKPDPARYTETKDFGELIPMQDNDNRPGWRAA